MMATGSHWQLQEFGLFFLTSSFPTPLFAQSMYSSCLIVTSGWATPVPQSEEPAVRMHGANSSSRELCHFLGPVSVSQLHGRGSAYVCIIYRAEGNFTEGRLS